MASAATNQFTCRASALKVTALGLVNVEPTIANDANDPCTSQTNSVLNLPAALNALLGVTAVNATTTSGTTTAAATGGVVTNLSVPLLGISAQVATSTANAACVAGSSSYTFTSSSNIAGLTIAGTPITFSGQQVNLGVLDLGAVATVNLNQVVSNTPTGLTRDAVDITIAGGLPIYNGVHIVLGEASVGVDGNPCTAGGGGGGGGTGGGGGGTGGGGGGTGGGGTGGGGGGTGGGGTGGTGGGGNGGGVTSPPTNLSPPVISGNPLPGNRLSCSTGTWTGGPTHYRYQWKLAGRVIAGATGSTYVVTIADEASSPSDALTCVVTAYNGAGASYPRTSDGVLVAVRGTLHCARPTGHLSGTRLGVLGLGLTQGTARHRLTRYQVTHNRFDNFCLYAGWGIRVAYPSASLMTAAHAKGLQGRVVIALTANPFYALNGTRPGARLTTSLKRRLRVGKSFHIGRNYWYVLPGGSSRGLIKVRGGVIQEVGIISRSLSNGRNAQSRLLHSFPNAF